jgi:hypothetical protein
VSRRRPVVAYRFELSAGLVVAALVMAPMLLDQALPARAASQVRSWLRSQWDLHRLGRALTHVDMVGSEVMDVVLDRGGSVWVLTKDEFGRFDRAGSAYTKTSLLEPQRYQRELSGRPVSLSAVLVRGADDLLLGDWEGRLLSYRRGKWEAAIDETSPIGRRIHAFLDHDGLVYSAPPMASGAGTGGEIRRPDACRDFPAVRRKPSSSTRAPCSPASDERSGGKREAAGRVMPYSPTTSGISPSSHRAATAGCARVVVAAWRSSMARVACLPGNSRA